MSGYRTWLAQVAEAIESGTMESRPDRYFTWMEVLLDERGWSRIMGRLGDLLDDLKREEAEAVKRMEESGEKPVRTTVGLAGFESPSPTRDNPKSRKRR